jgi:IMP dehydrogenase/GMP reductase
MLLSKDEKFDWNDIEIVPAVLSEISSRSEVNPFYKNGKIDKLPLFVAPMDTVVDSSNYSNFLNLGFEVCLPRGESSKNIDLELAFISYGLDEIIDIISKGSYLPKKVLIDVANGHMKKVYDTAKKIKERYPSTELMVGNIANPETFLEYCKIGVDYVRVGIGGGSACTTSANGAVHYPMGSLVRECFENRNFYNYRHTKIVADGGFRNYSDIIKALALGADYVMLGGIINKSLDSCSPSYIYDTDDFTYNEVDPSEAQVLFKNGQDIYKYFRGMSTKEVQEKWGREKTKTAEGITKYNKVEYTMEGWVENFVDYLRSNMSYCNKKNLLDYKGNVDYIYITDSARNRYFK